MTILKRRIVIYDNLHPLDCIHATFIEKRTSVNLISLPYSGHPSSYIVNDVYGLKKLVSEFTSDDFKVSDFESELVEHYS
ncbi:MAG: hypothetical protein ABJK64_06065 [Paraglaciecola sp.]|uniref:hypothetical protein n=1 Tax=Paraglaciecola sp. TaxID=1920173 RepID=UPI003296DB70